jgi:hypothetical protein
MKSGDFDVLMLLKLQKRVLSGSRESAYTKPINNTVQNREKAGEPSRTLGTWEVVTCCSSKQGAGYCSYGDIR